MKYDECPILTATRKAGKVSSNPCQNCAFYSECLDDLEREMGEEMMRIAGQYIKVMKDSIKEYVVKERKEMEVKK